MHSLYIRLELIFLALALAGCQPLPQVVSVEQQAAAATGYGEQFVFHSDGEPTDIEVGAGSTLTMLTATKLSLQHDPRIQKALAKVRLAQADAQQRRLLPNPVVEFTVRAPEGGGASVVDVGITAEIISLIRRPGILSAADIRFRAAHSEALVIVLDVVAELQERYIAVQSLDARIGVAQTRRSILRQLVDVSQSRVQAGEASRLDALTIQAEQAALETELIELRAAQRRARLALARMLGNPSAKADWPLEAWQAPRAPDMAAETWISMALQHRPEVQAQVWEMEALGEEVKLTHLSPFDGTELGAAAERDGDWSVGPAVTMPLPLFDLGQARQSAAEAKRIEARHQLTEVRRQIVQEVRQAIEQFASAQAALSSVENIQLPLEQQRHQQVDDAYRIGLSDITAVQLAEQDLQATISKRIELQEKLSVALILLQRAVGGAGTASTVSATTSPVISPNQ